jgi:putative Holliday junction resolvase
MRVLGLDWGTVRIGVAMSDEEQRMAFPLQNVLENKTALTEIKKLVNEYEIRKVVLGLPLSLDGSQTESSEKVKKFAKQLEQELELVIEYVDERFSTVASTKSLQQQKIKEKDQRQIKDNVAAALMLQQYLETKK